MCVSGVFVCVCMCVYVCVCVCVKNVASTEFTCVERERIGNISERETVQHNKHRIYML